MPAELPLSLGPVLLIGAGWLGEPLALQLQKQSIQVVVTARKEERISALQNTGLSAWRLDMEDSGETMGLSTRLNSFQTIIWAVPPGKTANVSYAAQLQRLLLHWPAESGRKLIFSAVQAFILMLQLFGMKIVLFRNNIGLQLPKGW